MWRDYLFVILIVASIPFGFFRPYYGMLVYTWVSYMYPNLLTYTFGQTFPAAKLAALSTIAGTILRRAGDSAPLRLRENFLMILLWGTFTMSTIFALNPSQAWNTWQDVSKLILMGLLTSTLLTSEKRIKYFFLVIALSLGFYGLKGGLFAITSAGQEKVWGPIPSIIAGNNNIGLALNMTLPILWYLAYEARGYLKILLYSIFFLSIPSIMFTYARASALTVPIVLVAILFKGRSRIFLVASMLAAAIVAFPLIPQKFWDRQDSTLTYESDISAMSRLDNWTFCWDLAVDRPLTGGGFGYNTRETFAKYAPWFLYKYQGRTWDTHSIYLAMLATHGFTGILVFLGMILSCFVSDWQMRRAVRNRPDLGWVTSYSHLVDVSLLALLVNGAFVNMEYFDLVYHLVGVVASMRVICHRALSESGNEEPHTMSNLVAVSV